MLPLKACPECRVEYQHTSERCSDCDVALVLATDLPNQSETALPPASELRSLRHGELSRVREDASILQEAGIACRIDSYPPEEPLKAGAGGPVRSTGSTLAVYVHESEFEAAEAALHAYHAGMFGLNPEEVPEVGAELTSCPACGMSVSGTDTSCSDCGLSFPSESGECSHCGATVTDSDEVCPNCSVHLGGDGAA